MPESSETQMNELSSTVSPSFEQARDSTKANRIAEWIKTTQGIITGVLALLVILPSVFNAVIDVYISFFNIPKSINEHNNQQLFQSHFQEKPIHSGVNVIKTDTGNLSMKINIYRNGDIFVEYGDYSQWFPYNPPKDVKKAANGAWFISEAYAADETPTGLSPCELAKKGEQTNTDVATSYLLKDTRQGDNLLRERIYMDGCRETLTINVNTGQIILRKLESIVLTEQQKQSLNEGKGIQIVPQVIDIQR
ncbi:MAG: hypothetical protein PHP00_00315 [Thiotrichaceae bacterium]|nr:hypothetical protein [Thiotrichaceae bacterium]